MSEILRPTAPRLEVRMAGIRGLAALAHRAEDTDDDILLLEVVDEVERRHHASEAVDFRRMWWESYMDLLGKRK